MQFPRETGKQQFEHTCPRRSLLLFVIGDDETSGVPLVGADADFRDNAILELDAE